MSASKGAALLFLTVGAALAFFAFLAVLLGYALACVCR